MLAWVVMIRRYTRRASPEHSLCARRLPRPGRGASALGSPTPSLHHFPMSPIFRTLFQVPYRVTSLFPTLTKTAEVCTNSSHSGTTSNLWTFQRVSDLSPFFSTMRALFCTGTKFNSFLFKRFRTLCQKPPGVGVPLRFRGTIEGCLCD
jgi:hypothetical protein